jgi:hypothetical protein
METLGLLEAVVEQIDIKSGLIVLGVTEFIKATLNVTLKRTYTDYMAPWVAMTIGQMVALSNMGSFGMDTLLYGMQLGGGAIAFMTLYKKAIDGVTWITKGEKDPILKAKVEASCTKAESQIEKMKALLGKNKEEVE